MSRGLARALAIGALVLCVASVVVAGVLHTSTQRTVSATEIVVVGDPTAPRMQEVLGDLERAVARGDTFGGTGAGGWVVIVLIVLFILLWLGTGALIVSRRSTNWAGWVFIITGAPFPLVSLAQAVMIYGLREQPGSVPLIGIWATFGEYALFPVALIPLLFLLYPDGHVPSRGWRWAVIALVGGSVLAFLGFLFRPGPFNNWVQDGILFENPLGVEAFTFAGTVIAFGTIPALVAGLSTAVAVVQRFRRSSGEGRQQMRVLAFVAALAGVSLMLLVVLIVVGTVFGLDDRPDSGGDWIFGLFLALAALTIVVGIPIAYLVAIFRYRLWDLDVVIKKTVVFGLVAAGITLLALVVVLALPLGVLGTGLSGWEWGLLLVGTTIGLLFAPLRRVARRIADRIVYRKRATPYEVLTAFSEKVGETYSTEDVLPRMVQLLVSGTGATSARVLLRMGSDVREVARWPEDVETIGDEHSVPVTHLGEELGALAVRMPANDPMDPAKEKLVADLAAQTGLVLRNVRLIEELRASRRRIVEAQDDRAKKLERNIHDGAQQQLVALQVKLRLAEQMADRDASKAKELLGQLQSETGQALEDLRDLARGIYPPLLADKGLAAALEAQARRSVVPVVVEPDGVGRLSREVEATVYFCVLEALQNMAKYAHASKATVTLSQEDGGLSFSVADDGQGFEPDSTRYGTGMQGMSDRLDAIGGTLEVRSVPGAGTTVTGRVPAEGAR